MEGHSLEYNRILSKLVWFDNILNVTREGKGSGSQKAKILAKIDYEREPSV